MKVAIFGLVVGADRFAAQRQALVALLLAAKEAVTDIPQPDPEPLPQPVPIDGEWRSYMGREAPADLVSAITRYFPREQWANAVRVSYHESTSNGIHWNRRAVLDTRARAGGQCGQRYWFNDEVGWATTEQSVGYFQINICAHGGSVAEWEDADKNVRKAAELFAQSRWRPWTVTARRLGLL